jgi:hypothetical protein
VTGLIPAREAAEGPVLALPRTADPVPGRRDLRISPEQPMVASDLPPGRAAWSQR